jgi:hypothetical protein
MKFNGLLKRNVSITGIRYTCVLQYTVMLMSKTEWTLAEVIELSSDFVGHRLPR